MNRDPLDVLRTSIDDSMPHAAAERVWSRANRRSRELRQPRGRWALQAIAALACLAAALAPAVVTSSTTAESLLPAPTVSVPGAFLQRDNQHNYSGQKSLIAATFWCNAGQQPGDAPITSNDSFAMSLALCAVPTVSRLPVGMNDPLLQPGTAEWAFPEMWWSRYALLSHGFQLCYSLEKGRVAVIPMTFPDGQSLRCQKLVILKID